MWTANRIRSTNSERGAANVALAVAALVILGAAAFYFLPGGTDGTADPEDNTGQTNQVEELPTGKTANKVPDSEGTPTAKGADEAGKPGTANGGGAGKVVLTTAEKNIMDWEGRIHDPALSAKEKLAALAQLRKTDKTGEQYAPQMNEMLKEAKDSELAIGVILEMRKRKNHVFGQTLLDAVVQRSDKSIQIAAIRTLGAYLEEPAIKGVLKEQAEKGDPELGDEIRAALEGRKDHWNQGQGR